VSVDRRSVRFSRDVRPLTDFRANAAAFIEQVQSTKQPTILTRNGRSAAVLLDIAAYEALIDEIELLREVRTAEEEVAGGDVWTQARVETRLRAMLDR
jgi:prevent-host-death family protein